MTTKKIDCMTEVAFHGVDDFNRIVFKAADSDLYYGSIDKLMPYGLNQYARINFINSIEPEDLVFFGYWFPCEPYGTEPNNKIVINKLKVEEKSEAINIENTEAVIESLNKELIKKDDEISRLHQRIGNIADLLDINKHKKTGEIPTSVFAEAIHALRNEIMDLKTMQRTNFKEDTATNQQDKYIALLETIAQRYFKEHS